MRSWRPWLLWCVTAAVAMGSIAISTAQTTFYLDPQGNDNNSGTSASSAWRSVDKVNGRSFSPGDRILFKRGGVWKEELRPSSSGTSSQPIIFGAYGSGAPPVLQAWDNVPSWTSTGNWSSTGTNQWTLSLSSDPYRVMLSGTEYMGAQSSSAVDSRSRWFWADGKLTVYAGSNPANAYSSITQSNGGRHALVVRDRSYVQFIGMTFEGGGGSCTELQNADRVLFDSCSIGAFAGQYVMLVTNESDYGVIRNCRLDRRDRMPYEFEDPRIGGQDCLAIQWGSNWEVYKNYFSGFGHTAVNLSGSTGNPGSTWVRYNRIHHNEFTNAGADYGRPYSTEGDLAGTQYCAYNDFYSNYVHNVQTRMQITGGHNRVYYNIIDTVARTPWHTSAEKSGAIQLSNYRPSADNEIYNNLLMNCQGAGISVETVQGLRFRVINNILYRTALDGKGCYVDYTGWQIWTYADYGAVVKTSGNISNNLFYSDGGLTRAASDKRMSGMTVTDLNGRNLVDGDTISGNIYGNPQLTPDYRIQSSSPAHDAGLPVGLAADYWGLKLPAGNRPDIGAAEVDGQRSTEVETPPAVTLTPGTYDLSQNFPNPFNPTTTIEYTLQEQVPVRLEVFDLLGRSVCLLEDGIAEPGRHSVQFDGKGLASGIYIYRLSSPHGALIRKMSLLK